MSLLLVLFVVLFLMQPSCVVVAQDPSIVEILRTRPDLTMFNGALVAAGGATPLLDDEEQSYTVFAPSDAVLSNDSDPAAALLMSYVGRSEGWHRHIAKTVNNHVVAGEALEVDDIFGASVTELATLQDTVPVSLDDERVGGASIVVENIRASNGVVHIVDAVIPPTFFTTPLSQLETHGTELGPDWMDRVALTDIVDFVDARDELDVVSPTGTTLAGCRIRALNRLGVDYLSQTINGAADVKYGEFLNESRIEETINQFILSSMFPQNYYAEDIVDNYQELVMPVSECSHVWITKTDGKLCFNDGCQVLAPEPRDFFASNGYVVHILSKRREGETGDGSLHVSHTIESICSFTTHMQVRDCNGSVYRV